MNKLKLATVGLAAMMTNGYAVDVTAVDGQVFKFREGKDTIVYLPSNATIRVSGDGTLDALLYNQWTQRNQWTRRKLDS